MAYVSGDVRGEIAVGQIRRIQAGNLDPETTTGVISANLTATGATVPTGEIGAGEGAIGYIIAGDLISGNVVSEISKVDRVLVGPSVAARGITGDIVALAGSIGVVYSAGPIGNSATTIAAANGIGEIRTVRQGGSQFELVEADVDATIVANQAMLDDPVNYVYLQANNDGPLTSLQVGGDLRGVVRAGNITCNGQLGNCNPAGIYVNGICYAPIEVDLMVTKASIVARTFMEKIEIGWALKGMVVATGGAVTPDPSPSGFADGRIPLIRVGRGESPGTLVAFYQLEGTGLIGEFFDRSIPTAREAWFEAMAPIDSIFHADGSIGEVDVVTLAGTNCIKYAPAIESPVIERLRVDALAFGSVWSGKYDPLQNDHGYAQIDDLSIGCTRQVTSVWLKTWNSAIIEGNCFGVIHVPSIPSGQTLFIGGRLGDEMADLLNPPPDPAPCDCTVIVDQSCQECDYRWNYLDTIQQVHSPRNPWWSLCAGANQGLEDRRGRIWIHDAQGLSGQIIINASNTGQPEAALWTGAVQVGETTGGCPLLEISPTPSSAEWESPHYDGLSAALGGGAVGLVPFTLHGPNCTPPLDVTTPPIFLSSALFHLLDPQDNETIVLDFRGPVTTEAVADAPFVIHRLSDTEEFDFSIMFMVDVKRAPHDQGPPNSRAVSLRGAGIEYSYLIDEGVFGVRFLRDDPPRTLLCDATRTEFGVPVAPLPQGQDYDYYFVVRRDCNLNGIWDTDDIAADPSLDLDFDGRIDSCYESTPCEPDINGDGNVDQDDHACLVQIIGGDWSCLGEGIDPDFNGDGNIDQDDVAALETVIAGGPCP